MKAMIFAAGLGTRLRPLTDRMPKALVPVCGKPLLQIVIDRLVSFGIRDIVVNVHHFAGMIEDYLALHPVPGVKVRISDGVIHALEMLALAADFSYEYDRQNNVILIK